MEYIIGGVLAVFAIMSFITTVVLRRVVPTNEVHILQSSGKTTSYGTGTGNGNVYYEWPTWMPLIGVQTIILPVSNFKLELAGYDAYDKDRLPFEIDVVAFFRVADSNVAAQRVSSIKELQDQLVFILKGAARTILASYDINEIMVERSKFGEHFTQEVSGQLKNWGVETVKNIELMDIRDEGDNKVIQNIMAKTKSLIEAQSRTTVAGNMRDASISEINAQRDAEMQKQSAQETVGTRNAQREQAVGIASQQAAQAVKEQERVTKEKEMAVLKVAQVQQASINKDVNIVNAEQTKQTTILVAEGNLESKKREAEGIQIAGTAKAEAEKAMQLAPVQAQIVLAKEIGTNEGYQNYLVTIRRVEATQAVGIEQAKALEKANIKIIANTGEPVSGLTNVMDLFTPKGGTAVGGMLEAVAQSETGKSVIEAFTAKKNGSIKSVNQ